MLASVTLYNGADVKCFVRMLVSSGGLGLFWRCAQYVRPGPFMHMQYNLSFI